MGVERQETVENEFQDLEDALVRAGREFDFPATPPFAARVRAGISRADMRPRFTASPRQWARVVFPLAAASILALALLVALLGTREAVAQFLRLRGLRIFYATPTPTAAPTQTLRPHVTTTAMPTATPTPTAKPFTLCCETTIEDAQKRARFKLLLPSNEKPLRVYSQSIFDAGEQIVMVFGDPANPKFTLYQAQRWVYGKILGANFGKEVGPQTLLAETQVRGARALWFSGAPHLLMQLDANGEPIYSSERVVDANTLVWETGEEDDGIMYRLETKASLREAVRFAESLVEKK